MSLISTDEMALQTGDTVEALYKRAQRGDIRAVRVGRALWWLAYEVEGLDLAVGHLLRLAGDRSTTAAVVDDLARVEGLGYGGTIRRP